MSPARIRRRHRALEILLPGALLAGAALLAVLAFATVDSLLSGKLSLLQLLTPDPVAAGLTLTLVGTSEGVAIAIVIVVEVLGIQLTADRYSPRIIDIFVRDPLNGGVLALFLGSIVFTIWVGAEVKADYVPLAGVITSLLLAVVDFAVLMPYVRYLFQIMRAETIIRSIRHRTAHELRRAVAGRDDVAARHAVRDALAQITDIALGSIQEGDTQVCLAAIEALREVVVEDYVPVKPQLHARWFGVGHEDMPGASDQTIRQVDRTRTWVEHSVLSDFLDLIGETPAFRKEVIHAIARATRALGAAAIHHDDADLENLVIRFFNTYLRAAMNQRAPTFVYSVFNEYRLFAVHALDRRPELVMRVADHLIGYGRSFDAAGMPFIIGTAAEDVADMTIQAVAHDADRALLLAKLLSRTLESMAKTAPPIALNGVLKAAIKLSLWAMAEGRREIEGALVLGVKTVPRDFVEAALQRMERTQESVFSEVSDRVVAFDWVEDNLRELIPALRLELDGQAEAVKEAAAERRPARKPRPRVPA
ncbi:MAG TPA: DUF2254 family protein [Candidatus Acidoferrales bacterium]|nr:DUF2254 family protein [Candidatus Acidoferrales bacterium]